MANEKCPRAEINAGASREYELTQAGQPDLVSIACRDASLWQTRLAIIRPQAGAGEPLDADAEKKALAGLK
ncbi:hypothetical protein [Ensifer sp. MJa1]|uniref:hypothetical protein n=1 Tax=Ensifer sp. MJa1 TaxID=2919888 RepID=UPI003008776B